MHKMLVLIDERLSGEPSSALFTATEALDTFDLGHEIVIESKLFACANLPRSHEYDMSLPIHGQILANQVRLTGMIDVTSFTAEECSVDNVVLVKAEIVAVSDSKLAVCNFTFVRNWVPPC